MKKTFKMAAFALCGMAMMSLTACLNGGDEGQEIRYKQISNTERAVIMNAVKGNYTGKLYFRKSHIENKYDSINVAWTITADTMLVIDRFPVKAVSGLVQAGTELQNKISKADPAEVKMKVQLPSYLLEDYYTKGYYLANPIAGEPIDVRCDDTNGKLTFANHIETGNIQTQRLSQLLEQNNGKQVIRLLIERITLDNQTYEIKMPFYLKGDKQ